uniref:Cystahionine gamma-synthase n=1 Tax=Clandestinovirus TaxID=2831644 RepID=A0A8F8KRH9_9VIRU|nr:cystahionine gamma-synthase [Clandestinovirus]
MFKHTEQPDHSVGGAIYLASSYLKRCSSHPKRTGASYSRSNSPNHDHLIESLKIGYDCKYCVLTTSGTSALSCILETIKPKSIVLDSELYCGTTKLVRYYQECGTDVTWNTHDLTKVVQCKLETDPEMVVFESCSNPSGRFIDIEAVKSRFPTSMLVVDNTTLSFALFNPFLLDPNLIVFESLTKYVGGGEVIMGSIYTNSDSLIKTFDRHIRVHGHHVSPFDAHLVTQSITTLQLRMDNISDKALKIATFLQTIPMIKQVYYPLLPNHPTFTIASKHLKQGAGMIWFHLPFNRGICEKIITNGTKNMYATSYGKPQSLFDCYPKQDENGTFVRLSIGHLWSFEELRAELVQLFVPHLATKQWCLSSPDWHVKIVDDSKVVLREDCDKVEDDAKLYKWK